MAHPSSEYTEGAERMSEQISESNRICFYIENTKRVLPSIKVENFWFIKAQGKTAGMHVTGEARWEWGEEKTEKGMGEGT